LLVLSGFLGRGVEEGGVGERAGEGEERMQWRGEFERKEGN